MTAAVVVAAYLVLVLVPSVICWLKGKRLWAVLGCLSAWHLIPMVRLAKPDSWWAGKYYDEAKLMRARQRFHYRPMEFAPRDVESITEYSEEDIQYQDKITRKAWKKAQKQAR